MVVRQGSFHSEAEVVHDEPWPAETPLRVRIALADARQGLDEVALAAVWAEGQAMTMEQTGRLL